MTAKAIDQRLQGFINQFGQPHLDLACHAAFPMALTPDLVYRLWAHFRCDVQGRSLEIPWVAVADVILSPFCHEVGFDLYEMEAGIRADLLQRLKTAPRFGAPRLEALAQFLLTYHQPSQLHSDDLDLRDLAQVQHWMALAQTRPTLVLQDLARTVVQVPEEDGGEWGRLADILARLPLPQAEAQTLLRYTRGMATLTQEGVPAALEHFRQLPGAGRRRVTVADVPLPLPEAVRPQLQGSPGIRRRLWLQWAGWGAIGVGVTITLEHLLADKPESPKPESSSETESGLTLQTEAYQDAIVMVNSQGKEVLRLQKSTPGTRWSSKDGFALDVVDIPASDDDALWQSREDLVEEAESSGQPLTPAQAARAALEGSTFVEVLEVARAYGQLGALSAARSVLESLRQTLSLPASTPASSSDEVRRALVDTYEAIWGRPLQPEEWDFVQFADPDSAGAFLMGAPEGEEGSGRDERPQHWVRVPAFAMGRYPVTQTQWLYVAENLARVNRDLAPDPSGFKGDDRPVERVSWDDAVEFCDRLSAFLGMTCRLPTEAEWEYACRAGTTTPFHFGETITPALANYRGSSSYGAGPTGEYRQETTPVGSFGVANAFGLYDMHGNVWEWCQDVWHGNYEGAPTDGSAWVEGGNQDRRVRRGGSWYYFPKSCRSAYRYNDTRVNRHNFIGFRVVCVAPT